MPLAVPQIARKGNWALAPEVRLGMRLSRSARVGVSILIALTLCVVWWVIASNYDYGALAGTYKFQENGTSSTLILRPDKSFHEEISSAGKIQTADGKWRRIGEGGVCFSIEFLRVPGARTAIEEFPDSDKSDINANNFYGRFEKIMGVYPELKLNANPPGPIFYKQLFR